MTRLTLTDREKISAIERELMMRSFLPPLTGDELHALASVCYKIGCDVDRFLMLVLQMGLDQLVRTDTRVMVWFSTLCGGNPELDATDDDLPF